MKKTLLLLLSLALLFALASCGSSSGESVEDGKSVAGYDAGNKAVDYSFVYPDTWQISENTGVVAIRRDCDDSDATARYASISVMAFTLEDSDQGAKQYWESYQKDIEKTCSDFKILNEDEITLGNTVALRAKYTGSLTETVYTFNQVVCIRNGSVYLVTLTAVESDYETVFPDFETVCSGFSFR